LEFMAGYRRVKYLIGEEVMLKAWERANAGTFPPEITSLVNQQEIQLLAAFCRELQREWGDKPFFLSCRMVQSLFLPVSVSTAWLWLCGLEAVGIIRTVKKGGPDTNKASRFLYLLPLD
jgi:hypothetical protein